MPSGRGLVILGSTGSIGRQALDVVRRNPGLYRVVGLSAGKNVDLLRKQIEEFRPRYYSTAAGADLVGSQGLSLEALAAVPDADLVLVATVGIAGLAPTLAAIRAGKTIALANKEVLVVAGDAVTSEARKAGVAILPVDSEHSAIWQCLVGEWNLGSWSPTCPVKSLVLTASGGAFRDRELADLRSVSPAEALKHPNWVMGPKVTVDSATLMNKGFEVIEAHWLFGVPLERIEVVLHRESVVHSLVEFVDGSLKAQLGTPDMRLPIQYALTHPERLAGCSSRLELATLGKLSFQPLDQSRYPCFRLAMAAARHGGTYPAALSGADEAAVDLFLAGRIRFDQIAELVEWRLDRHTSTVADAESCVEASQKADRDCRDHAGALAGHRTR